MEKIIMYITIVCFAFSLISCSDYLERDRLDSPSDQTFLTNETELQMALAGCYSNLWTDWNSMTFFFIFDEASDIGYNRGPSALQEMGAGAASSDNELANKYWKSFYSGIAKCNYLLQNMSRAETNVAPDVFAKIKAEARFLRALYYSYLIEIYGDVPLITEVLALETAQQPKISKVKIVDFILQELTEAAATLPSTNNPTSGHATKGAALAIKARTALYNEKWKDAISSASSVMEMEGTEYAIEDNYATLFRDEGQNSKEIIFSVQYLKGAKVQSIYGQFASRNAMGYSGCVPAYQVADCWECIDGQQIDKSPLFDPKHPYKNRDPRLGYTLAVSGSEFLGFQFETHGDSIQCWDYTTNKRINNLEATHAYATFTGLLWRKYANIEDKADKNNSQMNTILIRYPEVLLTYAEAKIKAGEIDASVLEAINKVRQRSSVNMPPITTTDPNELFYAVARERKYEFSGEGLRLFDIRRWKIAEIVMNQPLLGRMKKSYPDKAPRIDEWGTAFYEGIPIAENGESADFKMRVVDIRKFNKDRDYLWPIPYIERQTNPALMQNPNYE